MSESLESRRLEIPEKSAADELVERLSERIIGQPDAMEAISLAYNKARLRGRGRPAMSAIFLGPTGTGKTETAETLAMELASDKLNPPFIRIDCNQFSQDHEMSGLLGAPVGYVGREQPPMLDKATLEQAGSVLLFDEIEKAGRKMWNLQLNIMEGKGIRLHNGGELIDLTNTTVIYTSNVGASELEKLATNSRIGFESPDDLTKPMDIEKVALKAMKNQFPPEFINRLDSIVTFNQLTDDMLIQVLDAHVAQANTRYESLGNVKVELSDELKAHLVATAENKREFNARPVLRNYEKQVETRLSRLIGGGQVGGRYVIAVLENGLVEFYPGRPIETNEELIAIESSIHEAESEPECETDEADDFDYTIYDDELEDDYPEIIDIKSRRKK